QSRDRRTTRGEHEHERGRDRAPGHSTTPSGRRHGIRTRTRSSRGDRESHAWLRGRDGPGTTPQALSNLSDLAPRFGTQFLPKPPAELLIRPQRPSTIAGAGQESHEIANPSFI